MTYIPEYKKIIDDIINRIVSGELKPGDKLPTYAEIAEEFGVNVSTVRDAMIVLRYLGRVTGMQGKSIAVADPQPPFH